MQERVRIDLFEFLDGCDNSERNYEAILKFNDDSSLTGKRETDFSSPN